jgi:hypothetical protein
MNWMGRFSSNLLLRSVPRGNKYIASLKAAEKLGRATLVRPAGNADPSKAISIKLSETPIAPIIKQTLDFI